jgi:hypothetical protein
MTVKNSVFVGANAGGGDCDSADIHATDTTFVNNNNFYQTDADGDYTPDSTDQDVDPSFLDDTCTAPDLSPDAQAGAPNLYSHADDGIYCGAVIPYNYPSGVDPPEPEGTVGLWAERKQRVYECDFGTDAKDTLGRAIRIEVSSSDLIGLKLFGGMFLKVGKERLK